MKRLSALLLGAVLVTSLSPIVAKADKGYTYNYDWWEDVQYSPDMYEVVGVVTAPDMGVEGKLSQPQGMFVKGNSIYICDSGNNRIIEIERTGLASFKQKILPLPVCGSEEFSIGTRGRMSSASYPNFSTIFMFTPCGALSRLV